MSNKHFEDLNNISLERRYCDIEDDSELEKYGYTVEALPVVAVGAIAAVVAAVVVVMKLIWDVIKKKGDGVEEAIGQVVKKSEDLPNLTNNMINKLKAGDPRKILEDDNKWTVRDEHFIDGSVKEADISAGVKQIDDHYSKFADMYQKIEKEVLEKFYKSIDDLEKNLDRSKMEVAKDAVKGAVGGEKTASKDVKAAETATTASNLHADVKKIFDATQDIFKFDHCEDVLKKTAGYKPHTWINVKDVKTTQQDINTNIKAFYDSFKKHMQELSKDAHITLKMLEKANIPEPTPASVLKVDGVNNVKTKVKIDDDIKKLEDMGKKIEDRIKKLPEGNQKESIKYINQDLKDIKSTLALISTVLKTSMDIHQAYCGFYNRLLFCYVAVSSYQGIAGADSGQQAIADNTKAAEEKAKSEIAAEKEAAATATAKQ